MTPDRRRPAATLAASALALAASVALVAGPVAAHTGSLGGSTRESLAVPTWLFLATGGGVVGASFLLASFVTDRGFLNSLHSWGRTASLPVGALRALGRLLGLVGLGAVLYFGFTSLTLFGVPAPVTPYRNLAILVVWVAWWGGYVATTYLVGDTWPAINPFRTLSEALPSLDREYPERLGAWPSVVGLLALVWVEVTSPLADDPDLLAGVVVAYGAVTLLGAAAFGTDRWFETVDPVARLFRYYGHVAPVHRTDDGLRLRLRLPGSGLTGERLVTGRDEVAFVVAVLFVTTFDGFVATGVWASFARAVVGAGVPALLVYLAAYLVGFVGFYAAFVGAARTARRTAETYLASDYLARRFAPSLLAIAAGYHLAHNLGTFLVLLPTLLSVAASPASPPQNPPQLAGLPGWFGGLELAFVLVAHLLAVWVAHGTAYDLFPGRIQAVKSQYGVTLVMVGYTMLSLWIVSEPYVAPPFVAS